MSSTIGTLFKVSTFGESHGKGVGAIVDGCPARLALVEADIQAQLDRRRPGQSALTTPRQESDTVTILSGVENGLTLGTPIGLFVPNKDQRPNDYNNLADIPRPSHADYTYLAKYGIKTASGGGRSSARETIGRVAAGAIAEKFLAREIEFLRERGHKLELDKTVLPFLVRKGFHPKLGARPMRDAVEKLVGDAVSECLLQERPSGGKLTFDEMRDCLIVL